MNAAAVCGIGSWYRHPCVLLFWCAPANLIIVARRLLAAHTE